MGESDLIAGRGLRNDYSLGFGASAGIIKQLTDALKVALSVKGLYYEAGDEHHSIKASLAGSYRVTVNSGAAFSLSREKSFDRYRSDATVTWNFYL